MSEDNEAFMRSLINENDALVSCVLKSDVLRKLQYSEILNIKSSFEKLVRVIQGLPPNKELLPLEISLSLNYCYVLLFLLRFTDSNLTTSGRFVATKNDQQSGVNNVEAFDEFLKSFLFRVAHLKGDKPSSGVSTDSTDLSLTRRLIDLLLAFWIPGSAKVSLLGLTVAYCAWLMECRQHREARDTCDQLLQLVLPRAMVLFEIDSIDQRLGLLHVSTHKVPSTSLSTTTDAVRFLSAIAFFNLSEPENSLARLRQIETYPLKPFRSYAEGYILYTQNSFDEAFNLAIALVGQENLNPQLALISRNLIGCCLSSQGRHHSAVQVFKKCLQENFQFHVAMFNIALQYRKLFLFDAELEMLQLLAKLILEDTQNSVCCDMLSFCSSSVGSDSLFTQNSFTLNRQTVLYVCVRRLLTLKRYEEAVGVYLELFSSLSSSERQSCVFGDRSAVDGLHLPSIQSLYAQAIQACIDAGIYDQAIQFCDRLIDKFDPPHSDGVVVGCSSHLSTPRPSSSQFTMAVETSIGPEISKMSNKRLRETEDGRTCYDAMTQAGVDDNVRVMLFDVTILLYKSEALINHGSRNDSLLCVERAVDVLESIWKRNKNLGGKPPHSKRMKTDVIVNTGKEQEEHALHWVTSEAYSLKALVLVTLGRLHDALHWARLAYQLNSSDTDKVYNLALLLYKLQHSSEATSLWLLHRGLMPASNDTLQSDLLLKQLLAAVEDQASLESGGTNRCWHLLDIEALRMKRAAKRQS